MAATGTPGDVTGIPGGLWPPYNVNESNRLLVGNISSVGYINYTVCELWDKIAAAEVNLTTNSTTAPDSYFYGRMHRC